MLGPDSHPIYAELFEIVEHISYFDDQSYSTKADIFETVASRLGSIFNELEDAGLPELLLEAGLVPVPLYARNKQSRNMQPSTTLHTGMRLPLNTYMRISLEPSSGHLVGDHKTENYVDLGDMHIVLQNLGGISLETLQEPQF